MINQSILIDQSIDKVCHPANISVTILITDTNRITALSTINKTRNTDHSKVVTID